MITLENIIILSEINDYKKEYYHSLKEGQEFWLEQQLKSGGYFYIKYDLKMIGYRCISENKSLLQFYLIKEYTLVAQEVFSTLIKEGKMLSSYCTTFDHLLLSLCFDYQKTVRCQAYCFRSYFEVKHELNGLSDLDFRLSTENDLENINKYCDNFFEEPILQIHRKEIFVLYSANLFLGAGVIEPINEFSTPYVDIGMVVSEEYRNKGIATYIIQELKKYCISKGWSPICGCWYLNYQSKRVLQKSGFIASDRILHFEF